MNRSFVTLIVEAALFSAYYSLLRNQVGFPADIILALVGSLILLSFVNAVIDRILTGGTGLPSSVVGLLIFCIVSHGIGAGIIYLVEHREAMASPGEQESAIQKAVQDHDVPKLEKLLDSGVNPDAKDFFDGTPLLNNINDPDIVRVLLKHHANLEARDSQWGETPLAKAAREAPPEVVKMLISAGADLNAVSTVSGRTPLRIAIASERDEIVQLLLEAGAKDDRVDGINGTALPAGGGDVMNTYHHYMDAIFAKDIPGIKRVMPRLREQDWKTADWNAIQSYRVREPDQVAGFENEQAATFTVKGLTPSGLHLAWCYQMVKDSEGWVIQDEWELNK